MFFSTLALSGWVCNQVKAPMVPGQSVEGRDVEALGLLQYEVVEAVCEDVRKEVQNLGDF